MPSNRKDASEFEFRMKKGSAKPILIGVGIFVLIILISMSTTVVPAGHVGVKDLFGSVSDDVLGAGFHLVNPLVKVRKMSVQTVEAKETADVPSKEGLVVRVDVSLLLRLQKEKAAHVYRTVGMNYIAVVVDPQLRSVIRGVTAAYEAKALYTAERELIANQIQRQLQPLLEPRGVVVEKILLRQVALPRILSTAIERKLEAEQKSEQMKFVITREKQEAERKLIEAKGIANYQRTVAREITPQLLEWKGIEATEKLAASTNAKIIVVGNPSKGMPLIYAGQ